MQSPSFQQRTALGLAPRTAVPDQRNKVCQAAKYISVSYKGSRVINLNVGKESGQTRFQISPPIRILRSIALSSAQIFLRCSTNLLDRPQYLECAAPIRSWPPKVFGLLDRPPCNLQRFLSLSGGFWHAVPCLVLAKQYFPAMTFKHFCVSNYYSVAGFPILKMADASIVSRAT